MLGTDGNYTAYIACKCIGAVGIGQLQTLGPTYSVEVTPPKRRGFLVALSSVGQSLGTLVVACVCLRSSFLKIPIACQILVALMYGVVLLVFPESPRWLCLRGKEEGARKAFARYYHKDPNSEEVLAQVREVQAAIEQEKHVSSTTHWTEIFHLGNIRRIITAAAIPSGGALSGGLGIFTYAAIFLAGIGTKGPFVINVVVNACIFAGTFFGSLIIESYERSTGKFYPTHFKRIQDALKQMTDPRARSIVSNMSIDDIRS
ncbi:hypothetical protein MMC13_000201 [Lambiella insularis]|nr:hypothetical protein [Lambiella insularis]